MRFRVIDNKTGKAPTDRVITNIARKNGLLEFDIDCFAITEDGFLLLIDDCGNIAYCDYKRFSIELLEGD